MQEISERTKYGKMLSRTQHTYIKVTGEMPWFEKKELCDQLQRAAVSISSNIAEGAAKPSNIEFAKFLACSLGSAYEVETQLLIAKNVGYINDDLYKGLFSMLQEIEMQLAGFIRTLREQGRKF